MPGIVDRIQKKLEKRAFGTSSEAALGLLTANPSATDIKVDEEAALSWSALGAAIRIVATTVATLPLHIFRSRDGRGKDRIRDHNLVPVVHDAPNPEQTAVEFWESYVSNVMLWGDGFAEIVRDRGGRVRELWPLNPDRVQARRSADGELFYRLRLPSSDPRRPNQSRVDLAKSRMFHTRGFSARGVLGRNLSDEHTDTIGLGLATERYMARFFGNSSIPGGVIEVDDSLTDEAHQRMKDDWRAIHEGISNAHRIAILEEGSKWRQVTVDPEKAQALGLRNFQVTEASRLTQVPPHLLGNLERATFSNIEQQSLEFVIHTIRPWLRRLEARMKVDLLEERERRDGLFPEFLVEGLLRGDSQTRAEFYRVMIANGLMSPNEVRDKENLNPYDGGDQKFMQVNMMPVDQLANLPDAQRDRIKALVADEIEHGEGEIVEKPRQIAPSTEQRNMERRQQLVDAFRSVFEDATGRMVRAEITELRSQMGRLFAEEGVEGWVRFLNTYYKDEHPGVIRRTMGSTFRSFADAVAGVAAEEVRLGETDRLVEGFLNGEGGYIEGFTSRYSRNSRQTLERVTRQAQEDGDGVPQEAVDERLTEWEEGTDSGAPRAERWAREETHRAHNAVAKATFAAAGVVALVWRTVGDSCPLCTKMADTKVGINSNFVNAGESVTAPGPQSDLVPEVNIGHPPLHRGCDCMIVPSAGA